ncbi:MAG: hypothetical protein M0Z41_15865 [Peptococcaceae bacterium]|jgi:hypothetical protein|nr:hypothetical protein [Peptococcaceae bacterium]
MVFYPLAVIANCCASWVAIRDIASTMTDTWPTVIRRHHASGDQMYNSGAGR